MPAEGPLIRGSGTPESTWSRWLEAAALPALSLAELVHPRARLVVLAPHPDDEVLACGGLLAQHAASGGGCLVVAATDGEAADPGLDAVGAEQLASARRAERLQGLARLGAPRVPVLPLGLPDGGLHACTERLEQALQLLLRPGDTVLTTWRGDGHPDHEACGHAAAQAAFRRGARLVEAPVWMWHWAEPADARIPWPRLRGVRVPPDLRTAKRWALQAHASQLAPRSGDEAPVLGLNAVARMQRRHEHFFI